MFSVNICLKKGEIKNLLTPIFLKIGANNFREEKFSRFLKKINNYLEMIILEFFTDHITMGSPIMYIIK